MNDPIANPYLADNFAPFRSEGDCVLRTQGYVPGDLVGTLYRIGPNPQFEPRAPYHWFAGDGMVHAFGFDRGTVTYRNRYVRTPRWTIEADVGRALFASFDPRGHDPLAEGRDPGVANTSIIHHAGQLLALNESSPPFRLASDLSPGGYVQGYGPRVTAHPKRDPATGMLHWFAYGAEGILDGVITYGVTDAQGGVAVRKRFQAPYASMIHDFLLSEHHVVIPVTPLTANPARAAEGRPMIAWDGDLPTWLAVLRKDGQGEVRWYRAAAAHVFHVVNAWEEGSVLHADVFLYPSAPMFPEADGSPAKSTLARLHRWTLALDDTRKAVHGQPLDDLDGEFPRMDERWTGRRHRHVWFGADTVHQNQAEPIRLNALVHMDLMLAKRSLYELPKGDLISEPVFIPRRCEGSEGDGWVSAVAWRVAENRSDLLLFEATDVSRGPVMTAQVPHRVPFGFHGSWVPV